MDDKPIVSALLATNRPNLWNHAYQQYVRQNYGPLVLAFDDGDGSHGWKMNKLFLDCQHQFTVVFDDDDTYAPDRVSKLIQPMLNDPRILCVGTSLVYYVDERIQKAWLYDNHEVTDGWKSNPSLFWLAAPAYRRTAYELYGPWEDLKCGADLRFLHKIPRELIFDLRDPQLMVCRIHGENAAEKHPHSPAWQEVPMCEVPKL
jgi:glycosyltransferase involved in cell wall biosynthesis